MTERAIDGVFVAIGHSPATELVAGKVEMKPSGYVEDRAELDRDFGAGRCSPPATYRRHLPAGGHRRRPGLHGRARSRAFPGRPGRSRGSRPNKHTWRASQRGDSHFSMDWDKLKVFHAAAEAGSFTHAGEQLGLSQSAVSRQVSALEQALSVSLFHRHARGLILTEQGELLYRTAHEVFMKLESARAKLTDSRERPNGDLQVTTTVGLGTHWLTPKLGEFIDLYPDIRISVITTDEELDLAMREADVAIRLRQPTQPDLIQRKLFSVHFHAYAAPEYLKRFGTPRTIEDLDNHRILVLGGNDPDLSAEPELARSKPAATAKARARRCSPSTTCSACCAPASRASVSRCYRIIWSRRIAGWCSCSANPSAIALDAYFVYPEELKSVARVQVFRDFLVAKAQRWNF